MDFIVGTTSESGASLTEDRKGTDDAGRVLPLRTRDDEPLSLEPGKRMVIYGVLVKKRSPRHRRFLVHEVYVQEELS